MFENILTPSPIYIEEYSLNSFCLIYIIWQLFLFSPHHFFHNYSMDYLFSYSCLFFSPIIMHSINQILQKNSKIIGALAIAIGVHGSLHLGLEQAYGYNPLLSFFA